MNINLVMDKLKVRIQLKTNVKLDAEYQQIHAFKWSVIDGEFNEKHLPKGKVWPCKIAPITNICQPLNGNAKFLIKYGCCRGRQCVWFEFNPSKCDDDAFAKLKSYFSLLLENGFRSLVMRGVVTYSELAIDVDNVKFSDYIFIDTALRSGSNVYESLGTAYIGSKLGGRSFTCYDKRKEMLNNKMPDLGHDRLRIEAKLRGTSNCDFDEVLNRVCPFFTLLVLDAKELELSTDPAIVSFRSQLDCSKDSAQAVYSSQLKPVRTKLREAFQGVAAPWWQPSIIWERYPLSLNWIEELLV